MITADLVNELCEALKQLRSLASAYASDDGVWPVILNKADAALAWAEVELKEDYQEPECRTCGYVDWNLDEFGNCENCGENQED